ncbi:F0F1 ATP synthase subunit B [Priestia taiwanensis]|nr:F0F1 ATP synthase subunit B [Priestia taiwanensis]
MFVLGAGVGINTGDIIFQLVTFLILLALLKKYAFGPLMGIMKEREQHISSEIESAERNHVESKQLLEEQRALLKEARVEAQELIERAKKQAEDQKEGIIAAAKAEAVSMKEAAVTEIQSEKVQAITALQKQVASLSVLIASKVIEKELKEEDQAALVQQYIKEAGEAR